MNKKGQVAPVGEILLISIAIIIGVAMVGQVFDTQSQVTEKQSTDNKSINVSSAWVGDNEVNESINFTIYSQSDWKESECPLTSVVLRNGAGDDLTLTTDYLLYTSEGVFSLVNTTNTIPDTSLNLIYVDYTYCEDGYNTSTSSRGVAGLWGIFGALIILSAAVYGVRRWF
jgi:hypothetical protein